MESADILCRHPLRLSCPLSVQGFLSGCPCCKVPVQARLRSDKHAAVLRLQRTQPKDRRVYDGPYSSMCLPEKPKAPRPRLAGIRTGLAQVVIKGGGGLGMCIN